MTVKLPPEIWLYIVFLLPQKFLKSFKRVCRDFHRVVLTRQLRVLDLAPAATLEEDLEKELKRRICLAQENPLLVQTLRLIATFPIEQPLSGAPTGRGLQRFTRIFKDVNSPGGDLDARLTQLFPSLSQVRGLQIIDRYPPFSATISQQGPPWMQPAWETLAPTLTALSLSLGAIKWSLPQVAVSLPMLRMLKLQYGSQVVPHDFNLWDKLNNLTSRSPLLEEIQHESRTIPANEASKNS
ncbi:hypothetical protein DL96DRAFT_1720314 [Flagelloscypha sp. PMI_526]|nr:hypothetical protein DL96DRAFT_1720314 [Flagelloscypha sp. PMI_526]